MIDNIAMIRPRETLKAFMEATILGEQQTGMYSLEKPKVRELQMDWLRSEDLKEEKYTFPNIHYNSTCRSSEK